ncbi:30S ribosomal protein S20 [Peptoniphilus sp. GNH]|nr:30S ribosomal protein S20 [Peptoniphilus sp. GNH]
MANIKSAIKRIETQKKATLRNKARKSEIKNAIKKFEQALMVNNLEEARSLIKLIDKKLKRAACKNVVHKNAAARKISSLTKKLNAAG